MKFVENIAAKIRSTMGGLPFFTQFRELLHIANTQSRQLEKLNSKVDRAIAALEKTITSDADVAIGSLTLTQNILNVFIEDQLTKSLYTNTKYADLKKLNRYEFQVYSQTGEDGILEEIFERIGARNRFFVEFGAGNGLENNTAYLLVKGWSGFWIEADAEASKQIRGAFSAPLAARQLSFRTAFITSENIESMFLEAAVPEEPDLLSIDIDGNDYWVWKAIQAYRPRVVVIEYNALFRENTFWIMKYNPNAVWDKTCYQGASLKSLERLGLSKGYKLVGCNFAGVNAFFVREDLVEDRFLAPYTAENHYEPPRYHLIHRRMGHPRAFGEYSRDT